MNALAAIVLAGGRGTRMGGIAKPLLVADGATLLARTVAAARAAGADPVIVVGPDAVPGAERVLEDPPFGGPLAGIGAALPGIDAEEALVLAADLARPDLAVAALVAAESGPDGVVLVDPDGRRQWLTARYRVAVLRARLTELGDLDGAPARLLAEVLRLGFAPGTAGATADIDTWQDFERLTSEEDRDG